MLRTAIAAAVAFFVLAVVAGVFGFTGVAATFAGMAKILFYCFVGLAVLAVLGAVLFGRRR